MNRGQLAHVLRAAARIADDSDILVIGSQSILGTYDESVLPAAAIASIEVDVAFMDDAENRKSDAVDGAIGELSQFHETFGIYGQGVSISTATLPVGWRDRIVPFTRPDAAPSRARCLDPHDLVIAKLVASRPKDLAFASALVDAGLIKTATLRERAAGLESPVHVKIVLNLIEGLERRSSTST